MSIAKFAGRWPTAAQNRISMKKQAAWIKKLTRILGSKKVSVKTPDLEAHAGDAWFAKTSPEVVVFAATAQDVSETLKIASAHNIPVTARGAGRGYVGGCVPSKGGIALSLAKMNRIKEISVEDGVAVVEPGVITLDVQKAARRKKLFYPPDPASLKESSIGGNISTNAGGPKCLKYGVTRNFVLGLEVVLADGRIIRVGGRTVKNKTGFDLVGLFVGSEGLLGIVTEATLRLLPHPPARACVVATFAEAKYAARAVTAIQQAGILPAALEVADAFSLAAARKYANIVPPGDAFVLVEVDGQVESVAIERKKIAELLWSLKALEVREADGEVGCERLWALRRAMSESLKATGLKKLNEDVTVPRGRLVDLFQFAQQLQKDSGFPVACFGHAGDGNIHVNVMIPPELVEETERQEEVLDRLFSQILAWGGAITGEHGVGLAKKRWWRQAVSPAVHEAHVAIKRALDPKNLLNPGKFLEA